MNLYDKIRAGIETHGHFVLTIFGTESAPPFAYTIGLSEKYGHEIVVIGLPPEIGHPILNSAARLMAAGQLPLNTPLVDIASMPVILRECSPELMGDYGIQAGRYYQRDDIKFLQLVWPDAAGRFPEDPQFDAHMRRVQPLLYVLQ
jgi:hypothetical protein